MMVFNNKLLVAVLTMATMVTYPQAQDLLKTDPEVIKLCDKNGDGVLKGKNEGLCYLDLKKKKLDEKSEKLDEKSEKLDEKSEKLDEKSEKLDEKSEKLDEKKKKLDEDYKKLQKIKKILSNN